MKLFNKIAAASLVISILLCGMISCTPKEENAYKAHVITSFTSDDADLVGVIVQIEKSEVDLVVYGDNIMAKSATKFSDIQLDKTVTVYGDIVYNETTLVAEGKTVTEKQKANSATKKGERCSFRFASRLRMAISIYPKKPVITLLMPCRMSSQWGNQM